MSQYSYRDLEKLETWAANPFASDEHTNRWAIKTIFSESYDAVVPILFRLPISRNLIIFLESKSIEFDLRDSDGKTLLFYDTYLEDGVFDLLADYFESKGLIDAPDTEGFTALSHYVKFGDYEKSLALLRRGASPNSYARVARYGGALLSVAKQAILAMNRSGKENEHFKIQLLALLKDYGLRIAPEEKHDLLKVATVLEYEGVAKWLDDNL